MLIFARLMYGVSACSVYPTEFTPLPEEFDFDSPVECAKKVFAIMSNASGGHQIKQCMLRVDHVRRIANLTANGVHVFYRPENAAHFATIKEMEEAIERTQTHALGTVRTDQYGDGWKRAFWVPAQ